MTLKERWHLLGSSFGDFDSNVVDKGEEGSYFVPEFVSKFGAVHSMIAFFHVATKFSLPVSNDFNDRSTLGVVFTLPEFLIVLILIV